MPPALGRARRCGGRRDRRRHAATSGQRRRRSVRRIPRPPPVAAPRPRGQCPPRRTGRRPALDELALVGAPLSVLPHPAAPAATPVRGGGAAPRPALPPGNGMDRTGAQSSRPRTGLPAVGRLRPLGRRFAVARRAARLRPPGCSSPKRCTNSATRWSPRVSGCASRTWASPSSSSGRCCTPIPANRGSSSRATGASPCRRPASSPSWDWPASPPSAGRSATSAP